MALSDKNLVSLVAAEHVGPNETGDNVDAKRVVPYSWDGSSLTRSSMDALTDQLSHLVNSLKFLSTLQTPTAELRVSLNGLANGTQTIAALTNLNGFGGFTTQHFVMNQMNTNAATAIRANIITS